MASPTHSARTQSAASPEVGAVRSARNDAGAGLRAAQRAKSHAQAMAAMAPPSPGRRPPWTDHRPLAPPGQPYVTAEVFFEHDSTRLAGAERATLAAVAELVGRKTPERVDVDGYADVRGAESYNDGLSDRRVDAVLAVLEPALSAAALTTVVGIGHGEEASVAGDHAAWRKVRISARAAARPPKEAEEEGPTIRPAMPPEVVSREDELRWSSRKQVYEQALTGSAREALAKIGLSPSWLLRRVEAGYGPVQVDDLIDRASLTLDREFMADGMPAPQRAQRTPGARQTRAASVADEPYRFRIGVLEALLKRGLAMPGAGSRIQSLQRQLASGGS